MTKYEKNVWYGWNGGECPVMGDTPVEYVWHGSKGAVAKTAKARDVSWKGHDRFFVSSFRVIKEHKEPREFWAFMMAGGYWIESVPEAEGAVLFREVLK